MKQPQSFLFYCGLETLNSCNTNHCTSRSNMCAKIPTSSSRPTDHKSHQSGDATFGRGPFFICTLRRGGIAIDCYQLGHRHSVAAQITPTSDLCQPTSSSGSTDHSLANQAMFPLGIIDKELALTSQFDAEGLRVLICSENVPPQVNGIARRIGMYADGLRNLNCRVGNYLVVLSYINSSFLTCISYASIYTFQIYSILTPVCQKCCLT